MKIMTQSGHVYRSNNPLELSAIQQTQAINSASNRYAFIPTTAVMDCLNQHNFHAVEATQSRPKKEEKEGYQKHGVLFENPALSSQFNVDGVIPRLMLINSHDRSSSFQLFFGLFRFVCSNQSYIGDTFGKLSIKHVGFSFEQLENAINDYIAQVPNMMNLVDNMRSTTLDMEKVEQFGKESFQLRTGREPEGRFQNPALGYLRKEDQGLDLWKTYQRCQEILTKGGITYYRAGKRRTKLRGLTSLDSSVKFNQKLWNLAESYLQ